MATFVQGAAIAQSLHSFIWWALFVYFNFNFCQLVVDHSVFLPWHSGVKVSKIEPLKSISFKKGARKSRLHEICRKLPHVKT